MMLLQLLITLAMLHLPLVAVQPADNPSHVVGDGEVLVGALNCAPIDEAKLQLHGPLFQKMTLSVPPPSI